MKVLAIRQTIAEALEFANALEHVTAQDLAAFVAGSQPLTIEQIRLDSLARMELLIALETEHGVAVTPAAFERFESLAALADAIATGAFAAAASVSPDDPAPWRQDRPQPRIARLYERLTRHPRTPNQLNQLHIALENRITPAERDGLWAAMRSAGAEAATTWLEGLCEQAGTAGQAATAPDFSRQSLGWGLRLYQGGGDPADKVLILAFSTRGERLMMPMPSLLQQLDSQRFDLLLVPDRSRSSYERGLPPLAESTQTLIEYLARLPVLKAYGSVRSMGSSGGGYAALLAAATLGLEMGVSFAGRFPAGRHWLRFQRVWALRQARSRSGGAPLLAVFGGPKTRDRKFAQAFVRGVGARSLAIDYVEGEAGHLILAEVLERGHLETLIGQTICAEASAHWPEALRL